MKSIWNGAISFGLVSIPIRLFTVAQEHLLGFKTLCDKCKNPIRMKRWCDHCKKEVTWEHVVKGLEVAKGEFVVLTKETIKQLKPVKSTTINISSFVSIDLIDPVYFNTHYYAVPATKHKAYTLFNYALGSSGKVAIGSFVMRDREQVCMLQSYREGLLMTTLYYDYEVRPVEELTEFKGEQPSVSSGELKLAKQLIDQLTEKKFNMTQYKDTFAQELKKLLKKKKGKRIQLPAEKPTRKKNKRNSLINAHA